jgi:hypothetical protein
VSAATAAALVAGAREPAAAWAVVGAVAAAFNCQARRGGGGVEAPLVSRRLRAP